jgi:hypothetical protein
MKTQEISSEGSGIIALNTWLEQVGITAITCWRWRKKGWIQTLNISGRVYISREEICRFTKRAEAGEFHSEHRAPGIKKAA